MKKFSFRATLLLSTALLLTACDQNSSQDSQSSADDTDNTMGVYAPYQIDTPPPTLSGNFLAGEFAQHQSDWSHASDYFARILGTEAEDTEIQRRVMALDMGAGNYEKAIESARKIVASPDKEKSLAQLILSLSSFKNGQYSDAMRQLDSYKNEALGAAVLPILRAWTDAGQGKTNITGLKNSPSLLYQSVLIADYTKDKATISNLAQNYDFTKTPTPIARLENIAAVFANYGEKDEAKSIYTALMNGIPDRASFYQTRIKELDLTSSSISTPPASPQAAMSEALLDMARMLSNGYIDSARLFAHMSLFVNPINTESLELLAQISADNQLFDEATSYLARIDTTGNPDLKIQITRQTAQLKVQAGQAKEAIRLLSDLAETQKNVDAQIQVGDIYRSEENYQDALTAYDSAYKMLDDKITAQYWDLSFSRGMVNERLKNWIEAEKDLKTALAFQPDEPYVLNYLGYSWADQGINLDKAAEMIEKAVRLKPDDGAIVDSLGWLYFRMGQFDKAVEILEKAIAISPTEPEINDHLGDAYWRVGRENEAQFQWKRAVSFTKDIDVAQKITSKIESGLSDLIDARPFSTDTVEKK